MNIPLLLSIITMACSIYVWIGYQASTSIKTSDDYYLMGRNVSFFPLTLTLVATQLGSGSLIGASDIAYKQGWLVLFYPLGICLGLIILGLGVGSRLRNFKVSTIAEIFEVVYQSKAQRTLASVFSIVSLLLILVAQAIAVKKMFVFCGFVNPMFFVAFWSFLVLYTVMGGLKAVVNTDIVQVMFVVTVLVLVVFASNQFVMPDLGGTLVNTKMDYAEVPLTKWLLMPLCFMLIEQDMGQRCFAAKSGRVISFSAIAAGLILMACSVVAIYFGIMAKIIGIMPSSNSSILMEIVTLMTNPIITTLFFAALLMVIISTCDSLLCSISSNVFNDILKQNNVNPRKKIKQAKIVTLIIGLFSLGLVFLFDDVITLLMLSYELSVCILFVPIMAVILLPRVSKVASWGGMLAGGSGFMISRFFEMPMPNEIIALLMSLAGFMACYFCSVDAFKTPLSQEALNDR